MIEVFNRFQHSAAVTYGETTRAGGGGGGGGAICLGGGGGSDGRAFKNCGLEGSAGSGVTRIILGLERKSK